MATVNSRTEWVDIDDLTAAEAETAINAGIETLEAAGFICTDVQFQIVNKGGAIKQHACLIGKLPAYATGVVGNVQSLSLQVEHSDLTDADGSETESFASAIPEGSIILGNRIAVTTPMSGGVASDCTCDVGFPGDPDGIVDGADIFAAAVDGHAATKPAGINPNKYVTGDAAARTPQATIICGSDDVADLTAGDVTITLYYA
jgi:hypothetical protein